VRHDWRNLPSFDYAASMGAAMAPIFEQQHLMAPSFTEAMKPSLAMNQLLDTTNLFRAVSLKVPATPAISVANLGFTTKLGADIARMAARVQAQPVFLPSTLRAFEMPLLTVPMPAFAFPAALTDLIRGFDWQALERRLRTPRNWPSQFEQYLPELLTMLNDEGIPVAWVPRWELLEQLINVGSPNGRSELLVDCRLDIVDDCVDLLAGIETDALRPMMPAVGELLEACRAGFWKVAALAAVPLVHSVVESLDWATARQQVRKHHIMKSTVTLRDLMEQATRAPLVLFYDDWNPRSGQPRPTHLSRHVMSHRFGPEQVTDRNCVVAVMLLTSLFVTIDQLGLAAEELMS
jgi:hypothetical protein